MGELLKRAQSKRVVILDMRPASEYVAGHIPGAISVPVDDLKRRLQELTRGKEYVAYCRGPYCVYADRPSNFFKRTDDARGVFVTDFPNGARQDFQWPAV